MPRGDGTGPWGSGPIGRGRGGCLEFGRGFGFGRGMRGGPGRGFGFAGNAVRIRMHWKTRPLDWKNRQSTCAIWQNKTAKPSERQTRGLFARAARDCGIHPYFPDTAKSPPLSTCPKGGIHVLISIASGKGGTGKTTLALLLAGAAAESHWLTVTWKNLTAICFSSLMARPGTECRSHGSAHRHRQVQWMRSLCGCLPV